MTGGLAASLRAAAELLSAAGVRPGRMQAELLAAKVLGVDRARLLTAPEPTAEQAQAFHSLVRRRASGVPLQHLLESAPFRHLELAVGPGVFIPRPETELVVEVAQSQLAGAAAVVDLCAGSGAIAIAVATEFAVARVVAVERSPAALKWLTRNVAGLAPSVEVVAGDVCDAELLADLAGGVDVVLSNPPYVPEKLRSVLPVEVAHDPGEAVFAGPDGLALVPAVIATARRLLRPAGLVVLEHDDSHGPAVVRLLQEAGFVRANTRLDLTGRPRFASAFAPS